MATRSAVAMALGMAPSSLHDARVSEADWFPQDAVRFDADGRAVEWDLPTIVAAYEGHQQHRDALNSIRVKTLHAKVEMLELKVAELRAKNEAAERNSLPRAEWEAFKRDLQTVTRDVLSDLPAKLASIVTEPTLQARIHREVERILQAVLDGLVKMLEVGPSG